MRVITGLAKGRRLEELPGLDTRPTTARVKEGLFSAIQFDIEDAAVLDLFAGTGQMGIEALSRGAARADFVDQRRAAADLVRENLALCRLEGTVHCTDAFAFLSTVREAYVCSRRSRDARLSVRPLQLCSFRRLWHIQR